jgi:hypothetical protein
MESNNENKRALTFARKPPYNANLRKQREVSLVCNQLRLQFSRGNQAIGVQQYHIEIAPELEENMIDIRKKLFREIRGQMIAIYGNKFYITGNSLFATKFIDDDQQFTSDIYTIKIKKTRNYVDLSQINTITPDNLKVKQHLEIILKSIMRENEHLVNFRNQYYDFKQKTDLNSKYFQ